MERFEGGRFGWWKVLGGRFWGFGSLNVFVMWSKKMQFVESQKINLIYIKKCKK